MATLHTQTKEPQALSVPTGEHVDRIVTRYREPEWLARQRKKALEVYAGTELPSRVDHLWRYTDPKPFCFGYSTSETQTEAVGQGEIGQLWDAKSLAGVAVWQDGAVTHLELDPSLRERGVVLMDLHAAATDYPRLVEAHLGQAIRDSYGKFEMLNTALWEAGLFLHVPRHVVVEKPIHLIISGAGRQDLLVPRILVALEEGAQATVENEFTSPRGIALSANSVVEAVVGQAGHLRMVTVQRWGDRVTSYVNQRALLARDAQMLMVWAGLGAGLSKADIGTRLDGRGANVKLLGMSFGQRDQHFDHHTVHDHQAGNTYSDLDFKVVLRDKARSAYTGLIRIEPRATTCEAYQENRNLLLSDGTRADTIPELEILNDEVRCSHGATIGPLDEQEIFYLTSRGIPREEAIRMVVTGFVEPTLAAVPDDLRDRLRSYVIERVREI